MINELYQHPKQNPLNLNSALILVLCNYNKLLNLLANPAYANILHCLVVEIQTKVQMQFVLPV